MAFFPPLEQGRLLRRYKRFLADIELASGEQLTIHCPNTGSMLNCMREGGQVWFSRSTDPKRKLPGTWEISETPQGRLACVNTGRANALVEEALRAGVISELAGFTALRREVAYGEEGSRIDFRLEFDSGPAYVEVVTPRGAKHLRELATLARNGVRAVQLYCVNLTGVGAVRPAEEIDAAYAQALRAAVAEGVEVLAYGTHLDAERIVINRPLPVLLNP